MNFFRGIISLLYLLIYVLIGGALIVLSLGIFSAEEIASGVQYLYSSPNVKLAAGVLGLLFVLIGLISVRATFRRMKREKTIAFENPDGQVVVSLAAIEDFIKRIVKQLPQVKELKSAVTAGKRGITVVSKATLFSDSNIPETTEKIQSMIKGKLLEMLGIEESINIKIHIAKLIGKGGKEDVEEPKEASRHIPFRGLE
mgnify:CR=1 FL=1